MTRLSDSDFFFFFFNSTCVGEWDVAHEAVKQLDK